MTGDPNDAGERYGDCADWLTRGPYRPFVEETRTANGVSLVRGKQPPGHYPDPPFADYSLIYTTAGRCWADIDLGNGRKRVEITAGMMMVAPPDTACDYEKHAACETFVVGLPKSRLVSLSEQALGRPVVDLGGCHDFFRDPLVEALCLRLWDEAVESNPHGSLFADAALDALLATLLTRSGRPPKGPKRSQVLSGDRLGRVRAYIQDNLSREITTADLADVAHLSEFHFARLFKRATGLAPHQFVIAQRVERAKDLIRQGRLSLVNVAATVGFSSQSHLGQHFKRIVGCTPAEFRN
jgi:AraC family transcriptional regulator